MIPEKKDPETEKAEAMRESCSKCGGLAIIRYDPGCSYSTCPKLDKSCPCIAAVPDFDPVALVEKINEIEYELTGILRTDVERTRGMSLNFKPPTTRFY